MKVLFQEAKFEHQVRKNVYEERQNQLRWQSKLGDEQICTEDRAKILAKRNNDWNEYRVRSSKQTNRLDACLMKIGR